MKKRSLALWVVLFVALFVFLSGGCGGSSDSSYSESSSSSSSDEIIGGGGDGALSYKDYEGTWKYVSDSEDDARESEITISNAVGSNEEFTARLEGAYSYTDGNNNITTKDVTGEFTFTRVYAKDTPPELLDNQAYRELFDQALVFNFNGSVEGTDGNGRLNFAADENTGQLGKNTIQIRFLLGDLDWENEIADFDGYYERQ